ncbi:helix-turn-helix domain-containing protein [Spongiactinospora sp. TRM90649]|uniref:PucR family transcriptional regulator n=1 Tax=Spongiactinospora sp. TRM90649 TaxID=3031114 RepID=UPI0023F94F93|nr:helix-turn-helix domain-containing protein [Spongiactinospora sp. TRM90649]MDF5758683.1 helix-turn-helix domain-containing protein [Spongiactinospora sp. TRM90649]
METDVLARVGETTGVPAELLRGHLTALAQAAATGRLPDRRALDDCRASGGRAAEQGVAMHVLVEAALLAAELVPELAAESTLPALRRTVSALLSGYRDAQRDALRREEDARREFVDDLLQGRAERLAERAEYFGLRLAEDYAVAVAKPAGGPMRPGDPLAARVERDLIARFGSYNILVAIRDGLLVCVAPGSLAAAAGEFTYHVRTGFADGWRVGLGRPQRGPGGVVASFREAVNAVELGERLGLRVSVLKAADLLVFPVLLRDRSAIEDLVGSVLSPLLTARGGPEPLLATLEAVFASQGNQTAAARRLGLSTRAVTYRLERVRRLTGYSPDDPTQRFTLETAVLGARLLRWPDENGR